MWKERPWGRCPQRTRKPLKRFDPNFICLRRFLWGVAPNPTKGMIPLEPHLPAALVKGILLSLIIYLPQKRKLLQIGSRGWPPCRVLRDSVPEELFAYGVLFLFIYSAETIVSEGNDSPARVLRDSVPKESFYDSLISFSNAWTVFCKPSSLSSCFSIFEMA